MGGVGEPELHPGTLVTSGMAKECLLVSILLTVIYLPEHIVRVERVLVLRVI